MSRAPHDRSPPPGTGRAEPRVVSRETPPRWRGGVRGSRRGRGSTGDSRSSGSVSLEWSDVTGKPGSVHGQSDRSRCRAEVVEVCRIQAELARAKVQQAPAEPSGSRAHLAELRRSTIGELRGCSPTRDQPREPRTAAGARGSCSGRVRGTPSASMLRGRRTACTPSDQRTACTPRYQCTATVPWNQRATSMPGPHRLCPDPHR